MESRSVSTKRTPTVRINGIFVKDARFDTASNSAPWRSDSCVGLSKEEFHERVLDKRELNLRKKTARHHRNKERQLPHRSWIRLSSSLGNVTRSDIPYRLQAPLSCVSAVQIKHAWLRKRLESLCVTTDASSAAFTDELTAGSVTSVDICFCLCFGGAITGF